MADYRAKARRYAARYGLDPNIFVRQIQQESGFNPNARSGAGAIGIAQIMPATAKGWGVDPTDPDAALNAAAKNMAAYVRKYGSYKNALVAYNAGPGRVGGALPAETQHYIQTILGGRDPSKLGTPSGGTGGTQSTAAQLDQTPVASAINQLSGLKLAARPMVQASAPVAPAFAAGAPTPTAYRTPQTAYQAPARFDQGAITEAFQKLQAAKTATPAAAPAASTSASGDQSAASARSGGPKVTGSKVLELIFNDGGKGYGIKDGASVDGASTFSSVWAGHANHVHVAAGPKTVVRLGQVAQDMGLHVGENPHFGGVDPVHVPGSYHYKGEAIDVSGDEAKMAKFARYVASYNRQRA